MENHLKLPSSSRYIIEDSIPRVTSDGEPHELMTIVAVISGLIAAVIVLFVLFTLIGSRRRSITTPDSEQDVDLGNYSTMKISRSISTITPMFNNDDKIPQLVSVATISEVIQLNEGIKNVGFKHCGLNGEEVLDVTTLTGISTVRC